MKHILYILLLVLLPSSCNKKTVLLPETTNADITEILDVSPVYLFYDEIQPDSLEFNRKNMISTTNWLVNIDKRLTLKQVLPHLQYLQDKRHGDGMHTNKNAKNYFTCSNTDLKNLSFIEFTEVDYRTIDNIKSDSLNLQTLKTSKEDYSNPILQHSYITLSVIFNENGAIDFEGESLSITQYINKIPSKAFPIVANGFSLNLYFNNNLTFQDYISIKSELLRLEREEIIIDLIEFIY